MNRSSQKGAGVDKKYASSSSSSSSSLSATLRSDAAAVGEKKKQVCISHQTPPTPICLLILIRFLSALPTGEAKYAKGRKITTWCQEKGTLIRLSSS